VAEGVIGDLGEIKDCFEGEAVQGFHIFETFLNVQPAARHLIVNQGGKDEGIVRAG
jgi:hypothetical protein